MDDLNALIAASRSGDLGAYEEVVRRFQDMACGYAYALLGDFHLAEDAAQEAFIEAYRSLHGLREPRAFPGWFRKILLKHCDRLTRGKQLPSTSLETAGDQAATGPDPAESAEAGELGERVLRAVRALPTDQRTVTILFYIKGYSQDEVSEFLDVPVGTVKSRLHAARQQLRERMMDVVEASLKNQAPDERFSRRVIDSLLARPLKIRGHPIRILWDTIRGALPEYEVIEGDEIEDRAIVRAAGLDDYGGAYQLDQRRILRTQTTTAV